MRQVAPAIGLQKDHPNMPSEDNTDTAYPSQTSVFPYPMLHRKIMTLPDFPLPGSKSFSNPLSELRSRSKMTKYHLQCKLHLRYLPRNPSIVSPTPGTAISVSMPEQMYPANRQTRCGAGLFAAACIFSAAAGILSANRNFLLSVPLDKGEILWYNKSG